MTAQSTRTTEMEKTDGTGRRDTRGWARPIGLVIGLAALLAANYCLRHTLEESPKRMYSFLEYFYKPQLPIIFGQLPWWRLFLPLRELTGAWVTTTLILTGVRKSCLA